MPPQFTLRQKMMYQRMNKNPNIQTQNQKTKQKQQKKQCTIKMDLLPQLIGNGYVYKWDKILKFSQQPIKSRIYGHRNKQKGYPSYHQTFQSYFQCYFQGSLARVSYNVYQCSNHLHFLFPDGLFMQPGTKYFNHSSAYLLDENLLTEIIQFFKNEKNSFGVEQIYKKEGRLEVVCNQYTWRWVEVIKKIDEEMKNFTSPKMRTLHMLLCMNPDFDEDLLHDTLSLIEYK